MCTASSKRVVQNAIFHKLRWHWNHFSWITFRTGVSQTKFWEMLFCSFPNSLKCFQAEHIVYKWLRLTWKDPEKSNKSQHFISLPHSFPGIWHRVRSLGFLIPPFLTTTPMILNYRVWHSLKQHPWPIQRKNHLYLLCSRDHAKCFLICYLI